MDVEWTSRLRCSHAETEREAASIRKRALRRNIAKSSKLPPVDVEASLHLAQTTRSKIEPGRHLTQNGESALLFTDRGELVRARLTEKGYQEMSRAPVLKPTLPFGGRKVAWTPPAFANGHLFARSDEELVSVSLAEKR